MFETIFKTPVMVARYQRAPFAEERAQFLRSLSESGYQPHSIYLACRHLLVVARALQRKHKGLLSLTTDEVDQALWPGQCSSSPKETGSRRALAYRWLGYLGCLRESPFPFQELLAEYCRWMHEERGLCDETIEGARSYIKAFLLWLGDGRREIGSVRVRDVDRYLAYGKNTRHWTRRSIYNVAKALRGFFRYGGSRGWASPSISAAIHGPRLYALEQLPCGPTWASVTRMLREFDTTEPRNIRDRAIFMLLAFYGFRSIEVRGLTLDDVDWEHDLLRIRRGKRSTICSYPLLPSVGHALLEYLKGVRHKSAHRAVFLTLTFPYRPLGRGSLYHLVHERLKSVNEKLPHRGTHALRHAHATHLLSRGFSLKQIGDQLGHRRALSTRIYAKVDNAGLRRVADFDTGALS